MAPAKQSLYDILGVPRDANGIDIGLAYQRRSAQLQRAVPQDPGAQSLLHEAHDVLSNPKRRAAYDASLVTAAEKAAAAEQAEPDLMLEGEEAEPNARAKYVKPAIAAGAIVLIALFVVLRPGHKTDATPAAPVAEAPKAAPPPPPPQPLRPEQILASAVKSVGRVMSYEMSGRANVVGLSLAIEPTVMVTTCHGISGGSQLVVKVGEESTSGNLTVTDEALDLCRITVPGLNARPVAIAPEDARAGDDIYVIGANAKGDLALTQGKVAKVRTGDNRVMEISVPIAASASGGAVFDTFGRVVGIATTPHAYGANVNAAIPAAALGEMRSRERPAAAK